VEKHYSVAKSLAHLLDEQFRVGCFSIGVDPLLDFIPGIGSFLGLLLSFYIVWIAKQARVSEKEIKHMRFNIIFDFILGLIPILGFIGDAMYKANKKNLKILEKYIHREEIIINAEIISTSPPALV